MPSRVLGQSRATPTRRDDDAVGFVSLRFVHWVLLGRCTLNKAVTAALSTADMGKEDVKHFCGVAVADIVGWALLAAGPNTSPSARWTLLAASHRHRDNVISSDSAVP